MFVSNVTEKKVYVYRDDIYFLNWESPLIVAVRNFGYLEWSTKDSKF